MPARMAVVLNPSDRPADPACPDCGETLTYVESDPSASGAFRTQAVNMPQISIHYYDCPVCGQCWKHGTKLVADPVRQILKNT